ncbi:hypothetical protein C8Q75DRAFT_735412 [Abortiporus biennis]|nr:hypothetical protein C8Q75DRAFT_735412 [Abortiporus biennis]
MLSADFSSTPFFTSCFKIQASRPLYGVNAFNDILGATFRTSSSQVLVPTRGVYSTNFDGYGVLPSEHNLLDDVIIHHLQRATITITPYMWDMTRPLDYFQVPRLHQVQYGTVPANEAAWKSYSSKDQRVHIAAATISTRLRLDFIQAACGVCNAFVPTTSARNFPTTVQMSTCIFSVICSPLTPCDDRYYRHSQPTSQFQPCDPDLGYDKKTLMLILKPFSSTRTQVLTCRPSLSVQLFRLPTHGYMFKEVSHLLRTIEVIQVNLGFPESMPRRGSVHLGYGLPLTIFINPRPVKASLCKILRFNARYYNCLDRYLVVSRHYPNRNAKHTGATFEVYSNHKTAEKLKDLSQRQAW